MLNVSGLTSKNPTIVSILLYGIYSWGITHGMLKIFPGLWQTRVQNKHPSDATELFTHQDMARSESRVIHSLQRSL